MPGEELVLMMGGFGAVFGAIFYYFYDKIFIPMRWPNKVLIFKKAGKNAYLHDEDRAFRMVNKKTNEHAYKLRKRKDRVPPYDFEILNIDKRGKEVLMLGEMQKGQYFPVQFHNPVGLTVEDKGTTSWLYDEIIRTETQYGKKPGFIEQYLPFIMIGITAAVLIVLTVMFFQKGTEMAGSLNGVSSNMVALGNAMNEMSKTLINRPIVNTTPPI